MQAQKDLVTNDQRSSNTENQCNLSKRERRELRHEKNHIQMIKKHQESTYREKERIKDKGSKQEKRSDLQLKRMKLLRRQKRSDPEVKKLETELETKEK